MLLGRGRGREDGSPEEAPGGSQLGVLRARLGQLYSQAWAGPGGWEGGRSHPSDLLGVQRPDRSLSPEEGAVWTVDRWLLLWVRSLYLGLGSLTS